MREKGRGLWWRQTAVLTARYLEMICNNGRKIALLILLPLLSSIGITFVAGGNMFEHYDGTKSGLFTIVCAAVWIGLFNSIQEICKERNILKREYMTNLRLSAYMTSKVVVQGGICGLQSLLFLLVYAARMDFPEKGILFPNALVEYYLSVFLIMLAADCMGLLLSACVKSGDMANIVAPIVLIFQLIFSGVLFKLEGNAGTVANAMVSKWGMEAVGSISRLNDMPTWIQLTYPQIPHEAEQMYESTKRHLGQVWLILAGAAAAFSVVSALVLRRVSKDKR